MKYIKDNQTILVELEPSQGQGPLSSRTMHYGIPIEFKKFYE